MCDSIITVVEALDRERATALIHRIIRDGQVAWSQHAIDEMRKDKLTTVDCTNVLRAGAVTEPADLERGTWRYRVHTQRMCVVVAFRSDEELVVITVWRKRR
jgi:hypothetical protein